MNQELFLRDDIIDLSRRLDSENYNVKAYRKRNTSHINKNRNCLLSTDVLDFADDKHKRSNEKSHNTTDILSAKRLSATAGVRKRSYLGDGKTSPFIKTARTKYNSVVQDLTECDDKKQRIIINSKAELKEETIKKFSGHQKQYNKGGPIKSKHLENWLNQILQEYCHEQKFDSTIENPALKKYCIDKNSLLSKGINPQNLERIYKSLFVYSMGFNTLLQEIGGKNLNIRKTFWKVYAIMLEYCSDGDFETMIGQIERDKIRKIEIMKGEIQKRQQLIENNQQIHQEKNAKIFKELKLLRQENFNLENDKNVLMEDYKEAEQAFNEEVSLRLKFENKINQIHGVHRQLTIKHQRLYDDLQNKNFQNKTNKDKMQKLTQQFLTSKTDNEYLKKQNKTLKQEVEFSCGLMEELKKKAVGHEMIDIEWRHKKEQFAIMIREGQKRIEQIKAQLKNAELMIKMKEKSEVELQKQYKRSLDQNKQLVATLQEQLGKINLLMVQKKQFNDIHSHLYAEIQVLNRNLTSKKGQIQILHIKIKQLTQQSYQKQLQLQISQGKNLQLNIDMKDLFVKIDEMKTIKTIIEQQLTEAKAKEEVYKNYYVEKEKVIGELSEKVDELERVVSEFNITRKTLQSKINVLNQKISSDQEINKKKVQKFQSQLAEIDKQNKKIKQEMEEKAGQIERYSNLYEQTFNKLKDQLFERNDLELRYNQSLTVVESQTDHIKKLNIRMSKLQEQNEDLTRKLKGLQFILDNKEKSFQMELQLNHANLIQLKQQIKLRKQFIHPLKHEDLLSQLYRSEEKNQYLKDELKNQIKRLNIPLMQAKIKHMENEIVDIKTNSEDMQKKLQKDLQYQKQKNTLLQEELRAISINEANNANEDSSKHNYKEKQRKYLQVIKQKTGRVEDLLKQVEVMQDQNNTLIQRITETENILKDKLARVQTLEKEYHSFQSEKQSLIAEKSNLYKEKEKLFSNSIVQINESKQFENEQSKTPSNLRVQSRQIKSRQKSSRIDSSKQQQSKEKEKQPGWRNDFAKKVKNAYNYYQK